MIEVITSSLSTIATLAHLTGLLTGVVLGLVVGILPGMGGTVGLALLLPFVFGMEPSIALAMMIGLQSVTATSDTFPSVLMGIPGTSSSQATVLDGFPMSKRGEAVRALSAAFTSSMFGGLFGAVVLSGAIFVAIPIILAVGFGEQLMMIILALSMVGMLTGPNVLKGLGACALGLMIGSFGAAPMTSDPRLTFGFAYLLDPISLIVIGLAMFATPEIIDLCRRQETISGTGSLIGTGWLKGVRDWFDNWFLSLRCAAIGCLVGALPGLGGTVIDWIAYGHAVQTTKDKEKYGTGDIRGVIAPESANNAKEGGALIPTILFGIPGSGSMAILLGGFILLGIQPGAEMVTNNLDTVYVIVWSVAIANIFGTSICVLVTPHIAKLTTIRYKLIAPFMFGIIFFASFQATRSWGDLIALFLLSVLAVYMKRFGWPRPALLIGFVLAKQVESSVYSAVAVYGFSFLQRPLVIALIILTIASIIAAIKFKPGRPELTAEGPHSHLNKKAQLIFTTLLVGCCLYVLADSFSYNYLSAMYPRVAAILGLIFMVPVLIQLVVGQSPATVFFDDEHRPASKDMEMRSSEHYLLLLLGMLLGSAVVGFVLGSGIFIFLFLLLKARLNAVKSGLGAFAFILVLGIISHKLTLVYPQGLLQTFLGVDLPWPLQ